MIAWLQANLSTILVGLVLFCLLGLVVFRMIRQRQRGETSCGCGCANCAMKDACHTAKESKEKE